LKLRASEGFDSYIFAYTCLTFAEYTGLFGLALFCVSQLSSLAAITELLLNHRVSVQVGKPGRIGKPRASFFPWIYWTNAPRGGIVKLILLDANLRCYYKKLSCPSARANPG
jgi:hypothetical protein